jgi:hypothetical protein
VWAAARLVPPGIVQFYLQGLAGTVALWPLALQMWRQPRPPDATTASSSWLDPSRKF